LAPLDDTLARRWALRMLLLALIAVGVAAMHTIGHGAGASIVARDGHSQGVHASTTAPTQACHGMCPDPATGCLFIVTTTGLLLVIALAAASVLRSRTGRPGGVSIRRPPTAGRAPPPRWPIGLRLAELSVLRT
jgi:hypothetical protein